MVASADIVTTKWQVIGTKRRPAAALATPQAPPARGLMTLSEDQKVTFALENFHVVSSTILVVLFTSNKGRKMGVVGSINVQICNLLRRFLRVLGLLSLMAVAPAVSAKTITLEGLSCPGGLLLSNGYEGLNWNNMFCLNATTYVANPSGYFNGRVSGDNVFVNGNANAASFSTVNAGSPRFNLISMYLTGAWNNNLLVRIQTFRAGVAVTDNTVTVQSAGPLLVTVNAYDIDSVRMTSSGGIDAGFGLGGAQFSMDDLVITYGAPPPPTPTSVPTLSHWALCLLGGLMLAAVYQRRKIEG
jgi:IPTL-CTERM motif